MSRWTRANFRHLFQIVRFGRRPAVAIYESIGADLFVAPAPGWLNLGLWDGRGSEEEALRACERLVEVLADPLPREGIILDVGNGLGAQGPLISSIARPHTLIALNITEFQLRAGRARIDEARALPMNADAMAIPIRDGSVDGIISVEAAFHFPSRAQFFAEARRVLRAGGVLSMSDISVERMPRSLGQIVAGVFQMRFWGLRRKMLASAEEIAALARAAGFTDVQVKMCADRVIDPAIALTEHRLRTVKRVPKVQIWGGRWALAGLKRLRESGVLEYVLLTARAPGLRRVCGEVSLIQSLSNPDTSRFLRLLSGDPKG